MSRVPMNGGYSAEVRLALLAGEDRLRLSHVGPERVRLRHDAALPPQNATVIVSVDGDHQYHPVYLPDGIRPGERVVRIVAVTPD